MNTKRLWEQRESTGDVELKVRQGETTVTARAHWYVYFSLKAKRVQLGFRENHLGKYER
mgnify:CR=1 FL=1